MLGLRKPTVALQMGYRSVTALTGDRVCQLCVIATSGSFPNRYIMIFTQFIEDPIHQTIVENKGFS